MTTTRLAAPVLAALFALAIAGCTAATPTPSSTPSPEAPSAEGCSEVSVVVDFGVLDEPSIAACASAGLATGIFEEDGITTEGTVDYGDQVVCRVNDQPSGDETVTVDGADPFVETCENLNAAAYWALWVKNTPDGEWEYAQEGVNTLELTDGQSVGLVYTAGTESTPPEG